MSTSKNNFKFKEKNGIITLVGYNADDEIVVVPDEFDGVPVTVIGKEAFASKGLKEIVFPKHLELIEASAFYTCSNLKFVKFPDNFKELKKNAFENCNGLEEIEFPTSMEKVPTHTFILCPNLQKVTVNSVNTKIAPTAFGEGKSLTDVSFCLLTALKPPLQTKLIANYIRKFDTLSDQEKTEFIAFISKKSTVRKALFSSGEVDIISFLFDRKYKLKLDEVNDILDDSIAKNTTEVTAIFLDYKNKSFTTAEKEKFDENKDLVKIGFVPPTSKQFKSKWKCVNVPGGLKVTGYKGNETSETIPNELADGKKILELGSFSNSTIGSITSLRIEAQIKVLDNFKDCYNLEEIYLPDSIEKIKNYTFQRCEKLRIVNIPSNVKILPTDMFSHCKSLEEIVIPDGVETISSTAFYNCINLQKVTMKNPIIKYSAFEKCAKLADENGVIIVQNVVYGYVGNVGKVIVPEGVTDISCRAFADVNISEVVLPQSLVKITESAFQFSEIQRIIIPDGVTKIPEDAFKHCRNLKEIVLPKNLTSIGKFAFFWCTKMEKITFPETLEFIGENAFYFDLKIQKIAFPKSLKFIGMRAFGNCLELTEVTGLDGVKVAKEAFYSCEKLKEF